MADSISRNNRIDFLKGICIMFVVFTHFRWSEEERLMYLFPYWIGMAVPVFMIISGYVYAKSYERRGILSPLSSAYGKHLVNNITRYTVPYIMLLCYEILLVNPDGNMLEYFLIGGGGVRRILLSCNDTVCVLFPDYI